jgi:hypothetical protein
VLGEKRKDEAAHKRHPKARPVFLVVRRCDGRAKRTRAAVMAMENVVNVIDRGVTVGAREKTMDAAMVRTERRAPAYKVVVISEGVAIRGEVDEPFAGKGGCSKKTEMRRAV